MPKVSELVAMLKSPNANLRYDACEELRVMPTIPEDAKVALQAAMNDPDSSVADAATRALELHPGPPSPSDLSTPVPLPPTVRSDMGLAFAGLAVTVVSACLTCLLPGLPRLLGWGVESTVGDVLSLLAVPFILEWPLLHPIRVAGLLLLVAPCTALLLRGKPERWIVVIVAGCISGVIYEFATLIACLAFLSG